ncbi:MAG: ureidoglycolate lyase [Thermohalobaculum sp.]|nr:ureidoglycolate lyase [Thermohalobaculum sp.]
MILKPEPLLPDSFAPFGTVIETEEAERHSVHRGNATRHHRLAVLDPGPGGRSILSILRARRWPGRLIESLERHPLASRTYLPLTSEDWMIVAAPGPRPVAADCRLFHAFGDQGVQFAPGVWHHPVLPLAQSQEFLVIDRDGLPEEGIEGLALAPPAELPFG